MRAQPVDLIGGFYKDDALPWSCQDTVNWLPVMAEVDGTRSPSKLATAPGLKPWLTVGSGPIRGMHDLEGGRFVVSGQTLCRINPNKSVDPIGTIPGVGRVQMTHNQFKTGFQLLVENGQGGGGYVYSTADNTFAKITDEGYPGSISSDYLDSYLLGVEPQGRYWFHSNLADATDYNTLDRYEAEAAPDQIVGLAVSQFEVVVFGQRTVEFFFNAGGQTGTFQNRRQSITRGCASRHTIQKLDNTLFWLGDDGVVYRLDGYSPRPVSTRVLDRAVSGLNWAEAFAEVWEDRGHKVYYLTFPDGQTFGYDVITGLWHRRESFGLQRWRLAQIQKWGDTWYGGDFQSGRIWEIDWDYILEGSDPLVRRRVSPVSADNQSALLNPNAELVFDVGRGPETVATSFPNAITINGIPPSTLVGLTYPTFAFTGSGGTAPYTFSIASGSLPPGLSMSSTGSISGSSTVGGSYRFIVRAYDSKGAWTEGDYSIVSIAEKLALATPLAFYTGQYESLEETALISARLPAEAGQFAVTPSSAYLAYGYSSVPYLEMYKFNQVTGSFGPSTDFDIAPDGAVSSVAFSADSLLLAACHTSGADRVLSVYEFVSGIFIKKAQVALSARGTMAAWSPAGDFIVVATTNSAPDNGFAIYPYNRVAGAIGSRISPVTARGGTVGFSWSSDGSKLIKTSGVGGETTIWNFTGASVTYLTGTTAISSAGGAHFSKDGANVYFVGSPAEDPERIAAFSFSGSSLSAPVYPANKLPFAPNDSSFSLPGGYLAIARYEVGPSIPGVYIYRCSGTSMTPISDQPVYSPNTGPVTLRWTI